MMTNLPNLITTSRLLLAVVFFCLVPQFDLRDEVPRRAVLDWCLAVFALAVLTDWFDGYLARRRGLVTPLGRILDPFVDKVLICGTFAYFAGAGFHDSAGQPATGVRMWMVVLIVSRELLVTGLRGFSEARGESFAADLGGKAKMVIQSATALLILWTIAHPGRLAPAEVEQQARLVCVWATVIATAASMLTYLYRCRSLLITER